MKNTATALPRFEIVADGVRVWSGKFPPTQDQIDRAALDATAEGWNGTVLDLRRSGEWARFVYPSESALDGSRK